MNKNLFFLISAAGLLILSIICVFTGPAINKHINELMKNDLSTINVQKMEDDYNYNIDNNYYNSREAQKKQDKKQIDEYKKLKAMYGLEYSSFIADIVLGFICFFLGLIHYLEQGKPFEKYSGLIGTVSGVITAVLTIIYVGYSASIFNNQIIRQTNYIMLYGNKATYHWNGNKYIHPYDIEKLDDDLDVQYIKVKDLGKRQYNYDSELYELSLDNDSEYKKCSSSQLITTTTTTTTQRTYKIGDVEQKCEYIWDSNVHNKEDINDVINKFIYDRWLTTIILGVISGVCGLGLAIFGILLFL